MSTKILLRSFAGGEITPELAGRLDLVKFQTGLGLCRNFITLPHGPAARRTGFEFINEAKTSPSAVRLIPFSFSATQTAVLEFGDLYIRFHIGGATLLETNKTITGITQPAGVVTSAAHGYSNGNWVYLAAVVGMTQLNGRFVVVSDAAADTFRMKDFAGNYITTGSYGTYVSGGTAGRVYTLTSTYAAADLFDLHFAQSADVITITHPGYPTRELKRLGATNWTITDVSFAPTIAAPSAPSVTPTVAVAGSASPQEYCVTSVAADGVTESLGSTSTTVSNDLSIAGNYNTITWGAVTGATRYNIYKRRGGGFGYMGQTTSLSAVDENILADTTQSPPEDIIELNTGAGDYPAATTYHEQRRWFAGSTNKPQVVWGTRTGTESNLTSSLPSRDADGLEVRVASMQNNQIRHLVPLADLIALTAGGEFRLFADGAPAITPSSISIKPQGYSGASNVQPVVSEGSVLFVQAQGSRIRELAYNWESNAYRSVDVSLMAPHRFNGYTITQLAYTRAPEPTLWAVRNDGVLLGMTYVPDQQVFGWHAHDTIGAFESVCVVAEGNEDVLYVVVKREIEGREARYIERLRTRTLTALEDAFFVDSGLSYSGTPVTTLRGLWHLEGETVDILADGSVEPTQVVTDGTITLENAASKISVGLNIVADLRTLPLALEGAQASGQGTIKNVNKVHIRVGQSSLVKAGPSFDRLREYPAREVSDPYGSPPALRDGELSLSVDPSWSTDAAVCIRQDAPVPLTVLSMTLEVQGGG
jgi:hypothetical protein